MSLHPLEQAFHGQSWRQRVELIRYQHGIEMEDILLCDTSTFDPLEDDSRSYALVKAFWDPHRLQYPGSVDFDAHINQHMWSHLTDRLSG